MLDNFREWLSDNLRYILLGLAGILLIVIAFFAVRLVKGLGSPKKNEPETQQVSTERTTEAETEKKKTTTLVQDQPEILDLVTKYYTARANKDYDALAAMCEVFDDTARSEIESQDAAIESYSNIMTYSKPGMTDGSYVVYIYFDAKLTGIDTLAPSLRELYLVTDVEGNLMIADKDSNPEQEDYIEQLRADDDVQALIKDVDKKLDDACNSDPALKELIEPSGDSGNTTSGDGTSEDGDGTTQGDPVVGTTTGTMQATTEVNVRGTASTDGTLYGVLTTGMTVEVLENTDTGWSKVRYNTADGTTIEGYVMTQYLSEVQ